MAGESTIQAAMRINKMSSQLTLMDENYSAGYSVDVSGTFGPVPGAVTVPTEGVAITMPGVTAPGWCWLHNTSAEYTVRIGMREPDTGTFYPLLRLLPNMRYPIYLDDTVGQEYTGTGTGTGASNAQLWAHAISGPAVVKFMIYQN